MLPHSGPVQTSGSITMRFVETWRKQATLHIHITAIGESRHFAPCFFCISTAFSVVPAHRVHARCGSKCHLRSLGGDGY